MKLKHVALRGTVYVRALGRSIDGVISECDAEIVGPWVFVTMPNTKIVQYTDDEGNLRSKSETTKVTFVIWGADLLPSEYLEEAQETDVVTDVLGGK